MTDKVQKIREWVKARLDENNSKQSIPQFYGMMEEDARFLDFLESLQKEPVSEELEEAIDTYLATYFGDEKEKQEWSFLKKMAIYFAEWQEAKDQQVLNEEGVVVLPEETFERMKRSLFELAEKEQQMMAKAKSGTVQKDNQVILDNGTYIDLDPSMQLKPSFVGLKEGDRIKVIIIKED